MIDMHMQAREKQPKQLWQAVNSRKTQDAVMAQIARRMY